MAQVEMVDIPVNAMGESYGRFRLIHPSSEASMLESMRQFGQLLPVVVVEGGEPRRYELIDGFKRLRACRKLGSKSLQATVLTLGERPVKAAILQLNWKARSIREMEEAMIVQSLHREDTLSQVEIALLLGRHKSWVCRRISLVEKLADEVLSHLKLALITPGHGRELTRLPRGNQEKALETIIKHRLCCRETGKLVALLLERPKWEHESILHLPLEILDHRSPPRSRSEPKAGEASFEQELRHLKNLCNSVTITLDVCDMGGLSPQERQAVVASSESVANVLRRLESLRAPRGEIPTP
jgi:ParB/RepB/Spo0J family partition protein